MKKQNKNNDTVSTIKPIMRQIALLVSLCHLTVACSYLQPETEPAGYGGYQSYQQPYYAEEDDQDPWFEPSPDDAYNYTGIVFTGVLIAVGAALWLAASHPEVAD